MATKRNATSPPSKDGKKHKDEDCIICCKPATDNVMECVWCDARLHASCIKLSEEQCVLIGNASSNVLFFCTPCLQALPVAFQSYEGFLMVDARISTIEKSISESQTSTLQGLKAELTTLQTITTNLATKIKDLCTQNTTLQDQLQTASSKLTTKLTSSPEAAKSTFDVDAVNVVGEYLDHERRKHNLILYGLPEASETSASDRKQADINSFHELVHSQFNITNLEISKCFRLGRPQNGKLRPLLVTLTDGSARGRILRGAKALRTSSTYKRVYISPDLTLKEREANKCLRTELRRRKEAGETNLIIKHGKIVSKSPSSGTTSVPMESVATSN